MELGSATKGKASKAVPYINVTPLKIGRASCRERVYSSV